MRLIFILLFFIALESKAQYYIMAAPNVAFDTKLQDTKNLLGGTIEVGKYFGNTAVGERIFIKKLWPPFLFMKGLV
jgi:hypothetical protein